MNETVVQKAEREFAEALLNLTAEEMQKLKNSGSALADDIMHSVCLERKEAESLKELELCDILFSRVNV